MKPGNSSGLLKDCYFFGFGGDSNAFSKFARLGEMLDWYVPRIVPDKTHSVVCEREGGMLRHTIDGETWMEYDDPLPLRGMGHACFGFYIYGHGRIRNVKMYAK